MSDTVIEQLDPSLLRELEIAAQRDGVSLKEEARRLLSAALARPERNAADIIMGIMDPLGGVELDVHPRCIQREVRFDD